MALVPEGVRNNVTCMAPYSVYVYVFFCSQGFWHWRKAAGHPRICCFTYVSSGLVDATNLCMKDLTTLTGHRVIQRAQQTVPVHVLNLLHGRWHQCTKNEVTCSSCGLDIYGSWLQAVHARALPAAVLA